MASRTLRSRVPLALASLLSILLPVWLWGGGVLERESTLFIMQYTADRPFLQKIFDPHTNDFRTYQARELSYVFDWLNATCWMWLHDHGVTAFLSLSVVLGALLSALVYWIGARATLPRLDPWTRSLVLLVYLTSFGFVSTAGIFYRAGKPLLAPTLLALMFYLLHVAQKRSARAPDRSAASTTRDRLAVFALASVMGLLDRQGHFYCFIAACVLLVHWLAKKQLKDLLVVMIAAGVFVQAYNMVLGPLLVWGINGYWPSFWFQYAFPKDGSSWSTHVARACEILFENAKVLFGGNPRVGLMLLLVLLGLLSSTAFTLVRRRPAPPTPAPQGSWPAAASLRLQIGYVSIVLLLQVAMFAIMIKRHRYLYEWTDHWFWYYPLTFLVTLWFGLALLPGIAPLLLEQGRRWVVWTLLSVAILGNCVSTADHRRQMRSSHWFGAIERQTALLVSSLHSGVLDPDLDEDYRRFALHLEQRRAGR